MSHDSGVRLCGVNLSLLSYGPHQVRHSVDKRLSTPWRRFHFEPSLALSARAPVSTQLPCGKRFHSELCTHLFKKEVSIGQDQARGPTKGASHGASHHSNYLKFNQEKAVLCKTTHKTQIVFPNPGQVWF